MTSKYKIFLRVEKEESLFGKFVTLYFSSLERKPNILICPLDWGIGHATRCIPIIDELIQQNVNVIIGADNQPYALLKNEFPQLQFVRFPGYKFSYPGNDKMALKMAKQSPAILSGIKSENRFLDNLIQEYKIDSVISDNRFGLYNKNIPCIFMTHQLMIKISGNLRFLEPVLFKFNRNYIKKYNECWIPDWENGFTLSGDLSHKKSKISNVYYIGPLSRFGQNKMNLNEPQNYKYDFVIVISGPEPQRTIFEKSVLEKVKTLNMQGVVVLGRPELISTKNKIGDHITVYSHLASKELEEVIINSKTVISRPGYSSIMDIVALGKQAVFIPTPGQTEQEYLAEYYYRNGKFLRMFQHDFDLNTALEQVDNYSGLKGKYDQTVLKERISNLLRTL